MTEELAEPDAHYDKVVDDLTVRYAGVHDRDAVQQVVDETRHALEAEARVTSYLPVLVLRVAKQSLGPAKV